MTLHDVPAEVFLDRIAEMPAADADACLWERCRLDRALFCAAFLGERFGLPFNRLHRELLARPKTPWTERTRPQYIADAAPRGAAKSTLASFAELVHDAVYGFELYVPLLSTTYDLAETLVKDLHGAFTDGEVYEDLHAVYGPFVVVGTQTDFVVKVPGGDRRGVRFKAFSFGGTIRGTKHAGVRPTKVVIDDGEHPERVRSPAQREKTWSFLDKDVLKAGHAKAAIYEVKGTVLHAASMLADLLRSPRWRATKWRALESWPERSDLWEECRALWARLEDPDRVETARAFYEANQEEMDRGAVVLWPEAEDLFALHELYWSGAAAFLSEKQNEPVDPERQVYDPDTFRRCVWDGVYLTSAEGRRVKGTDCRWTMWLDPRASDEIEKRDYAALALVAQDRHGYRYVVSCDMRRDAPSAQRARVWALWERVQHLRPKVAYEDNGFAALNDEGFDRERRDRRESGRSWKLKPQGFTSTANKEDRIASQEPDITHGWLQFGADLSPEVLEQYRDFPAGAHDDGPDAIERACWLLSADHMPTLAG